MLALKDDLMPRYARLIYNGYWFSPERELLQKLIDESQKTVNGVVRLKLYKGTIMCTGRESKTDSLFDMNISTFEDDGGAYNQADAGGFIKLNALRLRIAAARDARTDHDARGAGEVHRGVVGVLAGVIHTQRCGYLEGRPGDAHTVPLEQGAHLLGGRSARNGAGLVEERLHITSGGEGHDHAPGCVGHQRPTVRHASRSDQRVARAELMPDAIHLD